MKEEKYEDFLPWLGEMYYILWKLLVAEGRGGDFLLKVTHRDVAHYISENATMLSLWKYKSGPRLRSKFLLNLLLFF